MTFKETLNYHLKAVKERDMEAFIETISRDERLTVIIPKGKMINGYLNVIEFHHTWFKNPDWTINFSILHTLPGKGLSSALLAVTYNDKNQEGEPYTLEYYLNLIFIKEEAGWLLIHDQNTMFPVA